jgi:hypothetical protein
MRKDCSRNEKVVTGYLAHSITSGTVWRDDYISNVEPLGNSPRCAARQASGNLATAWIRLQKDWDEALIESTPIIRQLAC